MWFMQFSVLQFRVYMHARLLGQGWQWVPSQPVCTPRWPWLTASWATCHLSTASPMTGLATSLSLSVQFVCVCERERERSSQVFGDQAHLLFTYSNAPLEGCGLFSNINECISNVPNPSMTTCVRLKGLFMKHYNNTQPNLMMNWIFHSPSHQYTHTHVHKHNLAIPHFPPSLSQFLSTPPPPVITSPPVKMLNLEEECFLDKIRYSIQCLFE